MDNRIETVIFELSAVINYQENWYVKGFPAFYSGLRDFNTVLLVSLEGNRANGFIESLKLDDKNFFFGSRIYYLDVYNEDEEIDLRIRKLLIKASIDSKFDLTRSLLITGDYNFYNTSVKWKVPCIVIRPDIRDIDSIYTEAIFRYQSYVDTEDRDILDDVFTLFKGL